MACNSQAVTKAAQCGDMEQEMFLSCLSTGCSASYQQDLAGTDACTVDGSTSTFSVDAGGSCGFSSSGSCYVICSCDEATEISVGLSESDADSTECLTASSPEWIAMSDTVQSLSDANTLLLSEIDTLKMEVARVSLSQDTLYESVDDLYGSMDTLHDTIDSMDEGTVIVSTYMVDCSDPYMPYYRDDGTLSSYRCNMGYGFDKDDMPYSIEIQYAWDLQENPDDPDCNFGNDYCFQIMNGSSSVNLGGSGSLFVTSSNVLAAEITSLGDIDGIYRVVITHDREYFAP